MNWDAIGAIAELLGAIATVATLAYLALQIRQNTQMGQVASATARNEQRFQQSAFIAQSGEINRLFWRGLHEPESLSADEYRHFESIFSTYFFGLQAAFDFRQGNAISDAEWTSQEAVLGWLLATPGFRRYWSTWGEQYPVDFSAFVADRMRGAAVQPAPTTPASSGKTSSGGAASATGGAGVPLDREGLE